MPQNTEFWTFKAIFRLIYQYSLEKNEKENNSQKEKKEG